MRTRVFGLSDAWQYSVPLRTTISTFFLRLVAVSFPFNAFIYCIIPEDERVNEIEFNTGLMSFQAPIMDALFYTAIFLTVCATLLALHYIHSLISPRQRAVENYRNERENGIDEDNPKHPFPRDGDFDWVLETNVAVYLKLPPCPTHYRCRYNEGPKDRAWMKERDRNYLTRRALEKARQKTQAGAGSSEAGSSSSGEETCTTHDPASDSGAAAAAPSP